MLHQFGGTRPRSLLPKSSRYVRAQAAARSSARNRSNDAVNDADVVVIPEARSLSTPTPTSRRNLLFLSATTALLTATATTSVAPSAANAAAVAAPATVFVAGATGETGRRTVAAFVEAGYRVRAGARNRSFENSKTTTESPSSTSTSRR